MSQVRALQGPPKSFTEPHPPDAPAQARASGPAGTARWQISRRGHDHRTFKITSRAVETRCMRTGALAGTLVLLTAAAGCSADEAAPSRPAVAAPTSPSLPCPAANWTCLSELAEHSQGKVFGPPRKAHATITGPTLLTVARNRIPGNVTFQVS